MLLVASGVGKVAAHAPKYPLGLRYAADLRTLAFLATYFVVTAAAWSFLDVPNIFESLQSFLVATGTLVLLCLLSFIGAIATVRK